MRQFLLTAFVAFNFVFSAQTQEVCGTDHMEQLRILNNPAIEQEKSQLEDFISSQLASGSISRTDETIVIPTVVHVMWWNCEGNISKAQVENGIKVMNDGFKLMLSDTADVRDVFKTTMGAMNLEFRLAQIDPNGNPTDGINRRQTVSTLTAGENVKSMENWPSNQYFNIWVVENIDIGVGGQVNGYAQFPTGNWNTYGVVIRNDKFGNIGTANADGSTMTHEAGHCFNLFHTFQDGCGNSCANSGDRVCDTPPAAAPDWSCSSTTNTCTNDAGGGSPYGFGTPDMMENFMSYSSCRWVFTNGQIARMRAAINISTLAQLTDEDNLLATGVSGFQSADFSIDQLVAVADQPASFSDKTSYGADAWKWNFGPSSFPPSSDQQTVDVTFIETGLLPVTLRSYFQGDSLQITKQVMVVSPHGRSIPFTDEFENTGMALTENWLPLDLDLNGITWQITSDASFSGEQSLSVLNYGVCGNPTDELISSSLDLEPFQTAALSFKVAYAKRAEANNDVLRIWLSRDFGQSWELFWVRGGNGLRSVTTLETSPWMPQDTSEWRGFEVPISSTFLQKGTMIKFEFIGDEGNNFFIDDIAVSGTYKEKVFLKSPANGKQGLPSEVLLDWKAVGDVDFYEYQVDQTTDFSSSQLITSTKDYIDESPDNEDTEVLLATLDLDKKYYWRVRYSAGGVYSDWSDVWNFRVSNNALSVGSVSKSPTVSLFPNPAKDQVLLASSIATLGYWVYDITGRVALSESMGESKTRTTIDLKNLQPGSYFVKVGLENGAYITLPLVVQ